MIVDENYEVLSRCRLMRGDVLEFDDGEILTKQSDDFLLLLGSLDGAVLVCNKFAIKIALFCQVLSLN